MDYYLKARLDSIKIVRDEVMYNGKTERCPLPLNGSVPSSWKGCSYCKSEFKFLERGCPCYAGYCKDRLIEGLNKWIKLAGEDVK